MGFGFTENGEIPDGTKLFIVKQSDVLKLRCFNSVFVQNILYFFIMYYNSILIVFGHFVFRVNVLFCLLYILYVSLFYLTFFVS